MRNDDSLASMFRRDTAKSCTDIFIGKAVKTVPPDPAVRQFLRQCEALCERRLNAVEGGIETRNLRNVRSSDGNRLDNGEVVRLVQRSEWA